MKSKYRLYLAVATLGVAAFAAGVLTVVAGSDPFRGGDLPTPATDQAREAEFSSFLLDEAGQLQYWLRNAAGEDVPCAQPCERDNDHANQLTGLLALCGKLGPADLVNAPGYRAAKHAELVKAMDVACENLNAAEKMLGSPADSPEWRQAAKRSVDTLHPAFERATAALSGS